MAQFSLKCSKCRASYVADMATLHCKACNYPLDVDYTDVTTALSGPQPPNWAGPRMPLPLHDADSWVSLGEGNTPCVRLPKLGKLLGLERLCAKLEFLNPTGSFKDRGTAIMMSVAREHGVTKIVEDSSGNAGASVSAYAARAGIKAHIFAPASTPAAKMQQVRVYGAKAHSIEGPREATTDAAMAFYTENRLVYASHNLSPYFLEGTKTFAYEVLQQFGDEIPDHIVVPVGNGSLITGPWKGFQELLQRGHISIVPRLHCIQARAVMPIAAAFMGKNWTPESDAQAIAGGIAMGAPPRKQQVVDILRDKGGKALAVEDNEILRWHRLLAEQEGIYAEPTSATAFAGLEALVKQGDVQSSDLVLVPITGFGLKDVPWDSCF